MHLFYSFLFLVLFCPAGNSPPSNVQSEEFGKAMQVLEKQVRSLLQAAASNARQREEEATTLRRQREQAL